MLKITREGMGRGADKQYHLLRKHWNLGAVEKPIHLYFNAFTRDMARLERMKVEGTIIVSRVGGWHFDSAEITGRVLALSDAAIFVSEYTQKLARKYFDKLPDRQAVIVNSAPILKPQPLANPPYLLVRAGGLGWPIWKRHMLSRSLSIVALWKIWPALRRSYPSLGLKIVGRAHHKLKENYNGDGFEYIDYMDDPGKLHDLGAQAITLVHLVIGDHSPNTVCEIIGEGRPAIVLDKGGAKEVAGCGAIIVPTERNKCDFLGELDVWWPLDKCTYSPSIRGLLEDAVSEAIKNHEHWQNMAQRRAKEIEPLKVARKYIDFIGSL